MKEPLEDGDVDSRVRVIALGRGSRWSCRRKSKRPRVRLETFERTPATAEPEAPGLLRPHVSLPRFFLSLNSFLFSPSNICLKVKMLKPRMLWDEDELMHRSHDVYVQKTKRAGNTTAHTHADAQCWQRRSDSVSEAQTKPLPDVHGRLLSLLPPPPL